MGSPKLGSMLEPPTTFIDVDFFTPVVPVEHINDAASIVKCPSWWYALPYVVAANALSACPGAGLPLYPKAISIKGPLVSLWSVIISVLVYST